MPSSVEAFKVKLDGPQAYVDQKSNVNSENKINSCGTGWILSHKNNNGNR